MTKAIRVETYIDNIYKKDAVITALKLLRDDIIKKVPEYTKFEDAADEFEAGFGQMKYKAIKLIDDMLGENE